MGTRLIVLTAMLSICGGCALAQDDEYIKPLPVDPTRIGEEVDALDPVFVYVLSKNGPPVLFACEEDRGCIPGDPKVLEIEELTDAEAALWTRVAEPTTGSTADPCTEFTTTSGKKVKKCYNEN